MSAVNFTYLNKETGVVSLAGNLDGNCMYALCEDSATDLTKESKM